MNVNRTRTYRYIHTVHTTTYHPHVHGTKADKGRVLWLSSKTKTQGGVSGLGSSLLGGADPHHGTSMECAVVRTGSTHALYARTYSSESKAEACGATSAASS